MVKDIKLDSVGEDELAFISGTLPSSDKHSRASIIVKPELETMELCLMGRKFDEERIYFILVIQQEKDGIYYRRGMTTMRGYRWESLKSVRKAILLG
jgi:hypothetical protein